MGAEAKEIDGYKLWYSGFKRATNGVGILVKKNLVEQVVEVRRKSDCICLSSWWYVQRSLM